VAIRDVKGYRLNELEAQFTGAISDIVGFVWSVWKSIHCGHKRPSRF